jgi:hypothetical protein
LEIVEPGGGIGPNCALNGRRDGGDEIQDFWGNAGRERDVDVGGKADVNIGWDADINVGGNIDVDISGDVEIKSVDTNDGIG